MRVSSYKSYDESCSKEYLKSGFVFIYIEPKVFDMKQRKKKIKKKENRWTSVGEEPETDKVIQFVIV